MHGFLHRRIKILHAKADSVKTHLTQVFQALRADRARVYLYRIFPLRQKLKMRAQVLPQICQFAIAAKGGRAAAEMQLAELRFALPQGSSVHIHFSLQ